MTYGVFAWKRAALWPCYEVGPEKGLAKNFLILVAHIVLLAPAVYALWQKGFSISDLTDQVMVGFVFLSTYLANSIFWWGRYVVSCLCRVIVENYPKIARYGKIAKLVLFWPEEALRHPAQRLLRLWFFLLLATEVTVITSIATSYISFEQGLVFSRTVYLTILLTGGLVAKSWIERPVAN